MKILVVSLLRLGDIVQQEPLLRGIRNKYPQAEIYILINNQFASVEKILSGTVDRFICFNRDLLQRGLGEAEFNILWSYSQLDGLISELNVKKYNQVYNFTHTKLSAYLIGALKADEKFGLHHEGGQFRGLDNLWLKYFNDNFSGNRKSLFNYVELLSNSFGIDVDHPERTHSTIVSRKNKRILFQCLTSDEKKNWGLRKFFDLKRMIEDCLVDYDVKILCAPFERQRLGIVFGEKNLFVSDLYEAHQHLRESELLVTGDTSIKHMGAQIGIPIIEIVLGSSDSQKTGAYSRNSVLIQSKVPCAPCTHSQDCSQKSHLCAEDISVEDVFSLVWDQLSGEVKNKRIQIRDFERVVWSAYLNEIGPDAKFTVPFRIDEKSTELLGEIKTQTLELSAFLKRAERALPARLNFIDKAVLHSDEVAELILVGQDVLRSKLDVYGYFDAFMDAMTGRFSLPVQLFDSVSAALGKIRDLIEIRNKLIDQIDTTKIKSSKEGLYYASGFGNASIIGFEENRRSAMQFDEGTDTRSASSSASATTLPEQLQHQSGDVENII
jgi:ADP-heptose:LPS heptosyltransferase